MQQALRIARDALEARVQERTAALSASNVALQAEVVAREQAEKALQHERDLLEVTLASIGDAVIATDATAALTFLNPVAETLTGWPAQEAIGRNIAEIFHVIDEQSRQVVENPVEKALREGSIGGLVNHTVLVARNGRETPVADSGAPIRGKDGQVQGAVMVFRDVTESKQAEAALIRAKEAAEAADRTKSEFLATMSHELRTPLHVILGYTDLLLGGEAGSLAGAQVDMLRRIDRNARVLFELITMVLDLNRLEAGRLPVEATEVRVAGLLAEIKAETQGLCDQSGLACVWRVDAQLPAIYTDPGKLKVVIKNLITQTLQVGMPNGAFLFCFQRLTR
jgi:PAS domain S-box-containing protein